jgi:CRISPR-associated endonuclease/helicase Cas3
MADELEPSKACFEAFFHALHGFGPWEWQTRAALELATSTTWPASSNQVHGRTSIWPSLSAPTGTGKTSLIECFLFALACSADDSETPRLLPLRLFWVVDRRNVVDQVYWHAADVHSTLRSAGDGVLVATRERLCKLGGSTASAPFDVRLWRGGLGGLASASGVASGGRRSGTDSGNTGSTNGQPHHAPELNGPGRPLSPCVPAIVCSTVDQVGSRLLFRGYGTSRASRPVEAALTGVDSLIVLDEAHISQPFLETCVTIARTQAQHQLPLAPVAVLPITATPRASSADANRLPDTHARDEWTTEPFALTEKERSEAGIARRLRAEKLMRLELTRDHVGAAVKHTRRLADDTGTQVIGVVVNLIADAREIARRLQQLDIADVVLMIGPVRPLDRSAIFDEIPARGDRGRLDRPLVVVGTQTLEVGLDLDLDALVTACAPLPALIQRLGRLDRAGSIQHSNGVVLAPPRDCPVYGEASLETWTWLLGHAHEGFIDLGVDALARLGDHPQASAKAQAPLLAPWHIETLTMTSEDPSPDQSVGVFLRGEDALDQPDVQICWRADLDARHEPGEWERRVRQRLPHPGELLSISAGAVRRWLAGVNGADAVSDLETGSPADDSHPAQVFQERTDLVVRVPPRRINGSIAPEAIHWRDVQHGDMIVVPSWYGGCDRFGWAPGHGPVEDLGNLNPARPRLLLSASLGLEGEQLESMVATRSLLENEQLSREEAYEQLLPTARAWLRSLGTEAATLVADALDASVQELSGQAVELGEDVLLIAPPPTATNRRAAAPLSYWAHADAVARRVRQFGSLLWLEPSLADTLELAAWNHDAGKLDRRFQTWLNGGIANHSEPLAKSGQDPNDRPSRQAAKDAGWPAGKRHEATSAHLIAAVEASVWPPGIDLDLLIHCIHTHHGDGRPFRSIAVADLHPVEVHAELIVALEPPTRRSVMSDSRSEIPWEEHAARFAALNGRFGAWGLAMLEALLVLADRAVSTEQGVDETGGER